MPGGRYSPLAVAVSPRETGIAAAADERINYDEYFEVR